MVAVAATVVGSSVATTTPSPATADFGTAQDLATFTGPGSHVAAQTASIQHRFGTVDVIENQTLPVPGSIQTYSLRAQNPHGPFGSAVRQLLGPEADLTHGPRLTPEDGRLDANYRRLPARGLPVQPTVCANACPGQP